MDKLILRSLKLHPNFVSDEIIVYDPVPFPILLLRLSESPTK